MGSNLHTSTYSDVIQGALALEPRKRTLHGLSLAVERLPFRRVLELAQLGHERLVPLAGLGYRCGSA